MAAGPFPTKQMHEDVKTRVSALEQRPAGGGGPLGLGVRTGPRYFYGAMSPGQLSGNREVRVEIRWRGAAQLVGGFRVLEATLTPADIASFAVVFGDEVEKIYGDSSNLKAEPYIIRGKYDNTIESGTEFTVNIAEEYQHVAEYGRLIVVFKPSALPKLPAMPIDTENYPDYLLPGTLYECIYQDDGTPLNMVIPVQTAARGVPSIGVVPPHSMPIVPAPTPLRDPGEDWNKQGGMEIVWPLGGVPYLRVFRTRHYNDSQTPKEYHLMLTPGAPPQ